MKADKQSLEIPKNISDQIQNDDLEVSFIQSKELITANRFDLAAKLIYLNFLKNSISDGFGKELYIAHQNVMNGQDIKKLPPSPLRFQVAHPIYHVGGSRERLVHVLHRRDPTYYPTRQTPPRTSPPDE